MLQTMTTAESLSWIIAHAQAGMRSGQQVERFQLIAETAQDLLRQRLGGERPGWPETWERFDQPDDEPRLPL